MGELGNGSRRQRLSQLGRQIDAGKPPNPVSPEKGHLPLGVLRSLTGFLESVLLALLGPGVTSEEASLLQRRPSLLVSVDEGAGNAKPDGAGLTGHAATVDPDQHVVAVLHVEGDERLVDDLLVDLVREVVLERPAGDGPDAGARDQPHPSDGLLAAP